MVRLMKGLTDAIGLTVVHPTWTRTKPDSETDTHAGWVFKNPGEVMTNGNGYGSFAFDDVSLFNE